MFHGSSVGAISDRRDVSRVVGDDRRGRTMTYLPAGVGDLATGLAD